MSRHLTTFRSTVLVTLLAATGCAVTRDQQSVGAYVDDAAITTATTEVAKAADALRSGRLVALNDAQIAAHYNLYAVWPPGHGERVAGVVEVVRGMAAATI